jgi:hypothetical protein
MTVELKPVWRLETSMFDANFVSVYVGKKGRVSRGTEEAHEFPLPTCLKKRFSL